MDTDLRNRVILPVVLPLGVLLGMVLFIGTIAYTLLHSTRGVAIAVAGVIATGLMIAMALASSIDERDMTGPKRAVIGATAVLPIVAALGLAIFASTGGVDAQLLAINAVPPERAPEGAITGAENQEAFCEMDPVEKVCLGDTDVYTMPAQPDAESFLFEFVNEHVGVGHNFQIFELAEDGGEPAAGEPIFTQEEGSDVINGVNEIVYELVQEDRTLETGEEFYYNCIVHPVMNGVLTIGEPVDGAAEG